MILEEIADRTRERMRQQQQIVPFDEIRRRAESCEITQEFPFEQALRQEGLNFICEVKKASPSKGIIAPDFPYLDIAREYERAGAQAISVLTEPYYFQGNNRFLSEIVQQVSLPVLRKDFTINPYMIYEAKSLGASAILLICALLSKEEITEYSAIASKLGLSALVEAHDEAEIEKALACKARIIGVNNRNLKDFTVDINQSIRLRRLVPEQIVFVSESGMKTPEDMKQLYQNHTNAVLIGETLMRSKNKKAALESLRCC